MNKIDDDEEEKYIKLSNNDVVILKKITPDDRYSELKKVKEIDNIIKDLKIYNDKIGEKCSKFFNKIAEEKEFKKSKLISNCKEIKDAINKKIKEEKKKLKSQKPIKGKAGKTPAVKKTDITEKDIPNSFWNILKQFGITPSTLKTGAMTAIGYLYSQYQQGNITTSGIRDWVNRNTSRLFDRGGGGSGGSGGQANALQQMAANQARQRANLNIRANTQALEGMMQDATMANVVGGSVPANSASNLLASALEFGGMSLSGLGGAASAYHGVNWMRNRFNQPYRPPRNMGIPREPPIVPDVPVDVFQDAPEIDPTLNMPDLNVPDMPEVPEGEPQQRIDEGRADLLDEEAVEEDQDLENRQMEDRQNEVNRQIDDMDSHGNAWGAVFSGMSSGSNKMAESTHLLSGLLGRAFALQQETQELERHIDEPLINIMPLYTEEQIEQRRNFQDAITGMQEQLSIQDAPQREELDEAVSEDVLHDTMKEMIIEDLIDSSVDLKNQEEVDTFLAQLISNVDQDVEHKEILTENINKIVNDLVGEIVSEDISSDDKKEVIDKKRKFSESEIDEYIKENNTIEEIQEEINNENINLNNQEQVEILQTQLISYIDTNYENKDLLEEAIKKVIKDLVKKRPPPALKYKNRFVKQDINRGRIDTSRRNLKLQLLDQRFKRMQDKKEDVEEILGETQGEIMDQIRRRIEASPPPEEAPPTSPYREFRQRTLSPVREERAIDNLETMQEEIMNDIMRRAEISEEGREAALSLLGNIIDEAVDEAEAKEVSSSEDSSFFIGSSQERPDTSESESEDEKSSPSAEASMSLIGEIIETTVEETEDIKQKRRDTIREILFGGTMLGRGLDGDHLIRNNTVKQIVVFLNKSYKVDTNEDEMNTLIKERMEIKKKIYDKQKESRKK